jgi:hypothetical protein
MSPENSDQNADELALGLLDEADERLLRELAAAYQAADPVPAGLVERLQFAVTLDALEAELARLQRLDAEPAGARSGDAGATAAQTVTFTSASLTTMVTITPSGPDRVRIDGWVAPGGGVAVELRVVGDALHVVADADGRFVFDDVPRGLAQFVLRPPDPRTHPAVITPSIEL